MIGSITRVQLIAQIQQALSTGHVIIEAPAGFGKTVLLQQLTTQRVNSHYLPLTVADSDVAALRARLEPRLRPGQTILLDDVHHLAGGAEAVAWLQAEIEAQGSTVGARFVLTGREIPFDANWLKGIRSFTIYRRAQLAFALAESAALLPPKAEAMIARWHEQLEGWPLGIGLLARLPAGVAALPEVKERLFAYLAAQVFAQLPDELGHFLQVTAVPLSFNDELAAHLLETKNAANLRQTAQQRNLFLYQDERVGWFRYHDLIRDYLLARADSLDVYRQKTITWFEAQDDLPQAIEHALEAGWQPESARLIGLISPAYIYEADRYRTYQRWVEALDSQTRFQHPALLFYLGNFLYFLENHEAIARVYVTQALAAAEAQGNRSIALQSQLKLASFDLDEKGPTDETVAKLSRLASEPELAIRANRLYAQALSDQAHFRQALIIWQHVVAMAVERNNPQEIWVSQRNLALWALLPLGRFSQAATLLAGALQYFAPEPAWLYETLQSGNDLHFARGDWPALAASLAEMDQLEPQLETDTIRSLTWLAFYRGLLATGAGQFELAGQHLATMAAYINSGDRLCEICLAFAESWRERRHGRLATAVARADAELEQPPDFPYHHALLALERDIAAGLLFLQGKRPHFALRPETTQLVSWRARAELVRLRALLALICHHQGDGRWRRHFQAARYALQLPGYERLLTDRDPELGGRFWQLAVVAGLALAEAGAALQRLDQPQQLYPLLAHPDAAVRRRAGQVLRQMGQEVAMPHLSQAIEREKDKETRLALTAVLAHLESLPPPPIQAQLLGEFRLARDGRPVADSDWPRPITRRLAQYFALHRGVALPRDQILDDLWPDLPPAKAWSNFRTIYSQLRRVVEPYMRPKAESRYFSLEGERHLFDPGGYVTVDVEEFETAVRHALATATDHPLPPLPDDLLTRLEKWQPLLPEMPYEEWLLAARERLETTYIEGCLYVARAQLSYGRPAEAVVWARRAIITAPWLEEGYCVLMRAYARQGQRSLALKTYEEAVRALDQELNAEPSPLTQWLLARLQRGEEI